MLTLSQWSLSFSICVQKVRKCGLGSSSGNLPIANIEEQKDGKLPEFPVCRLYIYFIK